MPGVADSPTSSAARDCYAPGVPWPDVLLPPSVAPMAGYIPRDTASTTDRQALERYLARILAEACMDSTFLELSATTQHSPTLSEENSSSLALDCDRNAY